MRKVIIFLLGFLPLLVGIVISWLASAGAVTGVLPYWIINVALLAVWFLIGFYILRGIPRGRALLLLHAGTITALTLIIIQEMIVGKYWNGWMGLAANYFYMPMTSVASWIQSRIFGGSKVVGTCLLASLLLLFFSWLGIKVRKGR